MNSKKSMLLQILVPVAFALMVTVNALANIIPINGVGTGEVSDKYRNLFAPAAITFAIWGVIYLFLFGFTLFYILRANKVNEELREILPNVAMWFVISSVTNAIWIFAWHYDVIWLTVILMLLLLISLILINQKIRNIEMDRYERIFVRIPFMIYFGWITVATIANITTFLVSIEWKRFGFSEVFWVDLIFVIGAIIGFLATLHYRSSCYNLTLIWAYVGILIKHFSQDGFAGEYFSSIVSALISLLMIVLAGILLLAIKSRKKKIV